MGLEDIVTRALSTPKDSPPATKTWQIGCRTYIAELESSGTPDGERWLSARKSVDLEAVR